MVLLIYQFIDIYIFISYFYIFISEFNKLKIAQRTLYLYYFLFVIEKVT